MAKILLRKYCKRYLYQLEICLQSCNCGHFSGVLVNHEESLIRYDISLDFTATHTSLKRLSQRLTWFLKSTYCITECIIHTEVESPNQYADILENGIWTWNTCCVDKSFMLMCCGKLLLKTILYFCDIYSCVNWVFSWSNKKDKCCYQRLPLEGGGLS